MAENVAKILVAGGGISGITVALEAAEAGYEVILVEKRPTLGGRVAALHQYFPKLCPPTCGLEVNYRRLRPNPRVQVLTNSEIQAVTGEAGNFRVTVRTLPTYVNERCVLCDQCTQACPVEIPSELNFGMNSTRAVHLPHRLAYPPRYFVQRAHCPAGCALCVEACGYGAIDLAMEARESEFAVGSLVLATGWKPYDAAKLANLGFSDIPDVITNVMMERLAAPDGPTGGKIQRPSDGKPVGSVAFVQCAGSRDDEHLPYCSSICCLASLKQARYVRAAHPGAQVTIFYIDIRTPGKYETFFAETRADPGIALVKGKVAKVTPGDGGLVRVEAEDILRGGKIRMDVDLVVLATGMQPNLAADGLAGQVIPLDENGFAAPQLQRPGIFAAGVAKMPLDVNSSIQDATAAALHAIQTVVGG